MLIALEVLDEVETESAKNAAFRNLEFEGPGCVYDRIAVMTVDLYKNVTNEGSFKVEVPKKTSSI